MIELLQKNEMLEFLSPAIEENKVLNETERLAEMSNEEQEFLNSLILRNKPKKLLELGVSAGGSSIIMLNAIKDLPDSKLYSVDYSKAYYLSPEKNTGYLVDEYEHLKNKWELHTGGLALDFIDNIGKEIDFCLIDTMHVNPGEILDYLIILPYLSDNATIVFHDTGLHTILSCKEYQRQAHTNSLLMSSVYGKKILQEDFRPTGALGTQFANIGATKITKETKHHIFEIFNLLTLPWSYFPTDEDCRKLANHFEKHYGTYYAGWFKNCVEFQKNKITEKDFRSSKLSLLQKIFSVKNEGNYKVVRICGIKFKIKRGTYEF